MFNLKDLYQWCGIPENQLEKHAALRVPIRIVPDADALGELMAMEFVKEIERVNQSGRVCHAIVPCGPNEWYAPFVRMINERRVIAAQSRGVSYG